MLLQLQLTECFLELRVGRRRFARDLRADERQVVLEVDRARSEVARLYRRHLGRTLAAGAGDGVVHLDGVGATLHAWVVGNATGVHELVLLELIDQRGEGFEGKAQALLEGSTGQLVGEGQGAEQKAGDQVTPDVKVFQSLGSLDRPGYHSGAHITFRYSHSDRIWETPVIALAARLPLAATRSSGRPIVVSGDIPKIPTSPEGVSGANPAGLALDGDLPRPAVERRDVGGTWRVPPTHVEYAALDLETTGLDPARDRVIEIGAVAFTPDQVTSTLEQLVDPGRAVPDAVLRLTGIKQDELRGASSPGAALRDLADFLRGRQPVGHGARLDVEFLEAAGLWDPSLQILDTLDIARILLPAAVSHSLPLLSTEMGFSQPRPHRALDDADATRQLLLRLRDEAGALDERLKESMLALVAAYPWSVARFFADALSVPNLSPEPETTVRVEPARRRRSGETPPDDPNAVAALLGPDGPLANVLAGYEHRESQMQMLLAVAQIQSRGGTLVVEAGTGTGKSLAYLVPSIARSVRHRERVVVSTNTHTLQEQLMNKDLPALREWLPWDFKAVLLKGRSNYVSLRRWRRYLAEPCRDAEDLMFKLKVLIWLHTTESGDRSELRLHGREEVFWNRIASDPMDCIGVHCTREDCYVHRARAEAETADVVVVNHSLLLADAEVGGGLLPEYDHLVIDEAHHLEDAATRGLRQEVDGPGLQALLERLGGEGLLLELRRLPHLGASDDAFADAMPLTLVAGERVRELFALTVGWVGGRLNDSERREDWLRITPAVREDEGWAGVTLGGGTAATAPAALDTALRRAVGGAREWLGGSEPDQSVRELEIIRGRLAASATLLDEALLKPDPNRVYWFTLSARSENLVLRAAPINVGTLLRERVYSERRSTVFT